MKKKTPKPEKPLDPGLTQTKKITLDPLDPRILEPFSPKLLEKSRNKDPGGRSLRENVIYNFIRALPLVLLRFGKRCDVRQRPFDLFLGQFMVSQLT